MSAKAQLTAVVQISGTLCTITFHASGCHEASADFISRNPTVAGCAHLFAASKTEALERARDSWLVPAAGRLDTCWSLCAPALDHD